MLRSLTVPLSLRLLPLNYRSFVPSIIKETNNTSSDLVTRTPLSNPISTGGGLHSPPFHCHSPTLKKFPAFPTGHTPPPPQLARQRVWCGTSVSHRHSISVDQATGSSIVSILNLYVASVTSVRRRSLICRIHASESCRNGSVRTRSRTSFPDAPLPMNMTPSGYYISSYCHRSLFLEFGCGLYVVGAYKYI